MCMYRGSLNGICSEGEKKKMECIVRGVPTRKRAADIFIYVDSKGRVVLKAFLTPRVLVCVCVCAGKKKIKIKEHE